MINRGLLIFLYVIISVSYAFSQSGDTDILSLVEQYKTGADSTQTRPQMTGALDFLLSATAEDTLRKPTVAVREVRIVERLEPSSPRHTTRMTIILPEVGPAMMNLFTPIR